MRDGVHVDLREDELAELAAVEDLLQHAHRLVVAHVLVDREDLAGGLRLVAQLDRLVERQRQRLLREDGLDVLLLERMPDQRRLLVGREGEVDDLDVGVLDQRSGVSWTLGMPQRSATFCGIGLGARGDGDDREAGLLVGGEMALGHDHAGADAADPVFLRRGHLTSGSNPLASAMPSSHLCCSGRSASACAVAR